MNNDLETAFQELHTKYFTVKPQTIYHYTDYKGLQKILEQQEIILLSLFG